MYVCIWVLWAGHMGQTSTMSRYADIQSWALKTLCYKLHSTCSTQKLHILWINFMSISCISIYMSMHCRKWFPYTYTCITRSISTSHWTTWFSTKLDVSLRSHYVTHTFPLGAAGHRRVHDRYEHQCNSHIKWVLMVASAGDNWTLDSWIGLWTNIWIGFWTDTLAVQFSTIN